MLMPAVRPVPTEGARPGKPPIESLSFDSLLEDVRQAELQTGSQTDAKTSTDPAPSINDIKPSEQTAKPHALAPLIGIDSIHNASIRRIVAEAAGK